MACAAKPDLVAFIDEQSDWELFQNLLTDSIREMSE